MKKSEINVLIVDDDKSSGLVLSESMKRLGFVPHHVLKAEDALQITKIKTIHCAIVDVLLPKTSGIDLSMELRSTRFGGAPIILISGIFKDKAFASESIRKTNATEFLFKPFGFEDISRVVNRALEPILSVEKWTVSSLLTHRLNSQREKVKAIERLGDISGFHFPTIISILLDSQSSGHINIVTDKEEIFGATVHAGRLVAADSKDFKRVTLDLLIAKGFLASEDVKKAKASGQGNVEHFLKQGFISPHAVAEIKIEQIYSLLDQLSSMEELQINYVPSEVTPERSTSGIEISDILRHIRSKPEVYRREANLKEFYAPVMSAPIRGIKLPLVSADPDIELIVTKGLSIDEGSKVSNKSLVDLLFEVHMAFLAREINFDDLAKVKSLDTLLERFERLYTEFKIRQPHEIFEYFGADSEYRVADVIRIYNEYVEANHPDKLPKGAGTELQRLCQDCYQMLTEAYEILSSESGRQEYNKGMRAQHGERQAYVHSLTEEGHEHLRRGQAQSALSMFREAHKILPSPRLLMLCIWADVKTQGQQPDREILQKFLQQLDTMTADDKKTPLYFMALGLVKRGLGDGRAAQGCFEKALAADSTFVEARRELNSIQTQAQHAKKFDLFNGDITDVVSQIFRRKKG